MNLENYTRKEMIAVKSKTTGLFEFCCEATEEGKKACEAMAGQGNAFYDREEYITVYFSAHIKTPTIKW